MGENTENSWGAQRALVMSKIQELTDSQKELTKLFHTLSENVTVLKVKLALIVTGIATVVSVVGAIVMNMTGIGK